MPSHAGLYKRDDRFALTTDLESPDLCYSEIRRYLLIILSKDPTRQVTWRDLAYRMRKARRIFTASEKRAALARLEASGEFSVTVSPFGCAEGRPTKKYGLLSDAQIAS